VEPGEEQVYFVGCGIATRGGQLRQLPAAIAIQIAPTAGSPAIDLEESGVWQRDVSLTVLHTLSDGSEGWAAIS
jgi:archaellin